MKREPMDKEAGMREEIDRLVKAGELETLVKRLERARLPDVRQAIEEVVDAPDREGSLLDLGKSLAERKEPAARQLATGLAAAGYGKDRDESLAVLRRLADDPDWTVRDSAGSALGTLLEQDFARVSESLRGWSGAASPAVRRVVLTAAMGAAETRRPEWAEPLLKLVEPLLTDREPAVRRTLGPLVLGTSLLEAYPDLTFEYLAKWSTSTDEQTLWNVAMAFSSSGAFPIAKKALIILRKLSLDERRLVWRAVASAMWKLGRKKPEIIRPELAQWLEDERRVEVAREALKHL